MTHCMELADGTRRSGVAERRGDAEVILIDKERPVKVPPSSSERFCQEERQPEQVHRVVFKKSVARILQRFPKKQSQMQRRHKMKCFLLLPLLFHAAFAVKHQLRHFIIASTGISDLLEFVGNSMFNGVQFAYWDGNKTVKTNQTEWAKKFFEENPQHHDHYKKGCELNKAHYRYQIENLKQQLNQSEGVHIYQRIQGCDWDNETGDVDGFNMLSYDGEYFISFNTTTAMWVTENPQAFINKYRWDEDSIYNEAQKHFYTQHCRDRIKTYMEYVKRFEKGPARPSVSLLQRTPSSPVSCHATGFHPDSGVMSWRKDGQEIHEDVHHWEILPNPNGTFQMTVELEISSIKPEDWRRYQCVFHLSGVKEEIVTRLDRESIRTNWVSPSEFPAAAAVAGGVIGLVLLALFITGLFIWKRKKNGFEPTNSSDPSSSETSLDVSCSS